MEEDEHEGLLGVWRRVVQIDIKRQRHRNLLTLVAIMLLSSTITLLLLNGWLGSVVFWLYRDVQ